MKVTPLEGNRHSLDGGALFGHVPKSLWKNWISPNEDNLVELASRALLIEDDKGDLYIFDGTIGTFLPQKLRERYKIVGEENRLLQSLTTLGISPQEIRGVILSHLHFDHVGGVLERKDGNLSLLFPKATYFVSESHFERAKSPKMREKGSFLSEVPPLLQDSKQLKLLKRGDRLPFESEWFLSEGHTTGLLIVLLYTPRLLALTTDLIPGLPWIHLPVTTGYDRFPEKGVEEKELLLQRVVREKGALFLTHDPKTPFAEISFTEKYVGNPLSVNSFGPSRSVLD